MSSNKTELSCGEQAVSAGARRLYSIPHSQLFLDDRREGGHLRCPAGCVVLLKAREELLEHGVQLGRRICPLHDSVAEPQQTLWSIENCVDQSCVIEKPMLMFYLRDTGRVGLHKRAQSSESRVLLLIVPDLLQS